MPPLLLAVEGTLVTHTPWPLTGVGAGDMQEVVASRLSPSRVSGGARWGGCGDGVSAVLGEGGGSAPVLPSMAQCRSV